MRESDSVIAEAKELSWQGEGKAAIRLLRDALAAQRDSTALRLALAERFRAEGNLEQAGRWGLLLDDWSTPEEQAAFAAMVRGWRANPWRLRRLLLVPDGLRVPTIPEPEAGSVPSNDLLETIRMLAGVCLAALMVLGVLVVFVQALVAPAHVHQTAVLVTATALFLLIICVLTTMLLALVRRNPAQLVLWLLVAAPAVWGFVLLVQRLALHAAAASPAG